MNSAECWQYLPVKVNILLSEFFCSLFQTAGPAIGSIVPKNCISNDNEHGRLYPYTCEHSLRPNQLPTTFRPSPPLSLLLCPSPPFFPLSRSIFFLSYLPVSSPSSPFSSCPLSSRFPYPLKRGLRLYPGKFLDLCSSVRAC
jgi:hypothetical protein